MAADRSRALVAAAAMLCLVLALGGQAAADAIVSGGTADTSQVIGRAAGSYLTGLRTYAAAALWNRIDPLMHGYYEGVPLEDQRYMLSTIVTVEALDPRAVQAYYVGSWILIANDRVEDGLAMARRGAENNPDSGLALAGYAQVQSLYGDEAEAVKAGERALGADMRWTDETEQVNSYAAVGAVFRKAGRHDLDAKVQELVLAIEAGMDPADAPVDHDHDGDGVADH